MKVGVIQTNYETCERLEILRHFTTKELLDEVSSYGIRHVKLWIKNHPFDGCGAFPWMTAWGAQMPSASSDTPVIEDMDRVWRHKGIDTYFVRFLCPMWSQMEPDDHGVIWEMEPTYDIACKLLKRYGHLDKTFVITNWESDWQWRGVRNPPPEPMAKARLDWLRRDFDRRQRDVEAAREKFPDAKARVLHAAVVNFTAETEENFHTNACKVIAGLAKPPDLVGLSHWGRLQHLENRLDYIQATTGLPPERIYIDEVGAVDGPGQADDLRDQLTVASNFGCPYAFIWQWKQTWYNASDNKALWHQKAQPGRVEWTEPTNGLAVALEQW